MNNKPCPICHSTDLSSNLWSMDEGEVDALECNQCGCGAPESVWNGPREPLREVAA